MLWTTKHLYTDTETGKTTSKIPEGIEIRITGKKIERYVTMKRERGIITHTHYYKKEQYKQTRLPYKTERNERTL